MTSTPTVAAGPADVVRSFFRAVAAGELPDRASALLQPDVRWRVPGQHPLSGERRSAGEVAALFADLGRVGFTVDMLFLAADGDRVVEVHRGRTERGDGSDVDLVWAMLFTVHNGRIAAAQGFVSDQAVADAFFHREWEGWDR
jgi:uncharacterized protein